MIGGLSFMNTWDFPVYGALVVGSLLLGRWLRREPLLPGIIFSAAAVALGYALYLPFYATFASQASGIGLNLFNGTRWVQFALMFAPFLVAGAAFLWLTMRQAGRLTGLRAGAILARAAGLGVAGLAAMIVGAVAVAAVSPQVREAVVAVMNGGDFLGVTRDIVLQRLAQRLTDPWVALGLLFAASLCAVLIVMSRRFGLRQPPAGPEPHFLSPIPFVLLLFMGGALLAASVEFVFLRDMFGTRMNTIFKFYYQAWTVWAVASGFALVSLATTRGISAKLAAGAVGVLVLAGVLYPLFAVQTRMDGHSGPPALDGGRYLSRTRPDDYQVIQWLNQNVVGAPTIAEAPGDRYAAYTYQGRISAFTGLPTLLGWGGHQNQWRGNYAEPGRREPMIEQLFATSDIVEARRILDEFDVRYVIVGQPERDRYPAEGLAKFDAFGAPVFRSGDTVVYQIAGN